MIRHLVLMLVLICLSLLTYVNIRVKVLARRGAVVPPRAFLLIRLFLDAYLLLELINACFVLVRLLLVVCGALLR